MESVADLVEEFHAQAHDKKLWEVVFLGSAKVRKVAFHLMEKQQEQDHPFVVTRITDLDEELDLDQKQITEAVQDLRYKMVSRPRKLFEKGRAVATIPELTSHLRVEREYFAENTHLRPSAAPQVIPQIEALVREWTTGSYLNNANELHFEQALSEAAPEVDAEVEVSMDSVPFEVIIRAHSITNPERWQDLLDACEARAYGIATQYTYDSDSGEPAYTMGEIPPSVVVRDENRAEHCDCDVQPCCHIAINLLQLKEQV